MKKTAKMTSKMISQSVRGLEQMTCYYKKQALTKNQCSCSSHIAKKKIITLARGFGCVPLGPGLLMLFPIHVFPEYEENCWFVLSANNQIDNQKLLVTSV